MIRAGLVMLLAALASAAPVASVGAKASERSAQSDCTREVQRRGYTVLWSGNFRQFDDGWRVDLRARDYRGRTTEGTCFVETRSGEVSLFGFGWGGGSDASGTFEFNCASIDAKYRECQLPVDGRVRLVKRWSEAKCQEGRSWGQRGDRVWVDRGCRAKFEVTRGGSGGGSGGAVTAERACLGEVARQGLKLVGQEAAKPVPGGYGMRLQVRRGKNPVQSAYCTYRFSNGRAELRF